MYRLRLKCDGTSAETRFRLKSAEGASVQSTTSSRGVRISVSNAGYTMFRSSVKSTGYPLHSPVPPSLSLPCVTVCHHISTGLYYSVISVWCDACRLVNSCKYLGEYCWLVLECEEGAGVKDEDSWLFWNVDTMCSDYTSLNTSRF